MDHQIVTAPALSASTNKMSRTVLILSVTALVLALIAVGVVFVKMSKPQAEQVTVSTQTPINSNKPVMEPTPKQLTRNEQIKKKIRNMADKSEALAELCMFLPDTGFTGLDSSMRALGRKQHGQAILARNWAIEESFSPATLAVFKPILLESITSLNELLYLETPPLPTPVAETKRKINVRVAELRDASQELLDL